MRSLRVTRKDGFAWTVDLRFGRVNVGRDAENEIVLDDPAVSRQHCLIECDVDHITVKDRGTSNGTFLNNEPLSEPTALHEGDRLYVGPYLIELVSIVAAMGASPVPERPRGPVLRLAHEESHDTHQAERLRRWALEWDAAQRPAALLLRGRLLRESEQLARAIALDPIAQRYVKRSARRRTLTRVATAGGVILIGGSVATAGLYWWNTRTTDDEVIAEVVPEPSLESKPSLQAPPPEAPRQLADWVEHAVIPAESLDDIARRYEVSSSNLARWNGLNPDDPDLSPGQVLRVRATKTPLPQQLIEFELDRRYDWKALSERFGVEADKLQAYNPDVEKLSKGMRINVWVNPKPYERRSAALEIPKIVVRPDARSIGAPNEGRLQDGIQMPESPLYVRRAPFIMWASSHTIETLVGAIARFRQDLAFDHELVVADMSRKKGGSFFPPHKSHQAGRDVDIWMPSLKGVYKTNYLGKDRKPQPNEIDWFATWGLVRALLETEDVVKIFLTYPLQENLYKAAKAMGATEDELKAAMQWPRGASASGKVGHAPGHTGHIHVRFRCGPDDLQCRDNVVRNAEL